MTVLRHHKDVFPGKRGNLRFSDFDEYITNYLGEKLDILNRKRDELTETSLMTYINVLSSFVYTETLHYDGVVITKEEPTVIFSSLPKADT
jgi:hypothetical protein